VSRRALRQVARGGALAGLAAAVACSGSLPPLRGQMEVGRDAYAVFVAGGGAAGGDLYAVRTEGGSVVPITFSSVGEMRPALSTPGTVWVMNLLSGAERQITLPKGSEAPSRVGWTADGRALVVATRTQVYSSEAPPRPTIARPVTGADRTKAESTLAVLLGRPAFARVVPCAEPEALCVAADTGRPGLLARGARDAARWGDDSVMFFLGDAVEIRPLGPGRARRLDWEGVPPRPRQMTVFPGVTSPR
jgi:hypothetical protein